MYSKALSILVMPDIRCMELIDNIRGSGSGQESLLLSLEAMRNELQEICSNEFNLIGQIHTAHASEVSAS